jgi:endonuclease/exonuclease/phosphatase family metal-dependent hydrolase
MLSIITYNVEYGKKIDGIYKWINLLKKSPDIICLQEFPIAELKNLKKIKVFEELGYAFVTGLKKNGESFGELTLFEAEKIKLVKSIEVDLGSDHAEKFYKRYPTRRSALITKFKIGKQEVSVINVHLSAASLNSGRRNQIKTLVNMTDESKTLIVGDFNYTSIFRGESLLVMMENEGFKLAGENIITNKYKGKISQRLDYIFYKGLLLDDLKVFKLTYSDHYPILAELNEDA